MKPDGKYVIETRNTRSVLATVEAFEQSSRKSYGSGEVLSALTTLTFEDEEDEQTNLLVDGEQEEEGEANQEDTRSERDEKDGKEMLEEIAVDTMAESYLLKHALEMAIDEHLVLQGENEMLKKLDMATTTKIEKENGALLKKNHALIEKSEQMMKELEEYKSIIERLEFETMQIQRHGVLPAKQNGRVTEIIDLTQETIDLTHVPDHY